MTDLSPKLRQDAELIVDVCMSVEENDVVTIITDDAPRQQAEAVAHIAVERGAFPVIANNEHQVRRGLADTRFPMAPPKNLHQAMVNSSSLLIWNGPTALPMFRRSKNRVQIMLKLLRLKRAWAVGI
jgi:hypothetical protein